MRRSVIPRPSTGVAEVVFTENEEVFAGGAAAATENMDSGFIVECEYDEVGEEFVDDAAEQGKF